MERGERESTKPRRLKDQDALPLCHHKEISYEHQYNNILQVPTQHHRQTDRHTPVRVQSSGMSMSGESSPPRALTSLFFGLLSSNGCLSSRMTMSYV